MRALRVAMSVSGLFESIAREEVRIRADPRARTTGLPRRVFAAAPGRCVP